VVPIKRQAAFQSIVPQHADFALLGVARKVQFPRALTSYGNGVPISDAKHMSADP